jgi:hypothetical protein
MRQWLCVVVSALCVAAALPAQHRVDPRYSYHRVIAVVPLVGAGTAQDPIRGKYVPTAETAGPLGTGIIAFAVQLTDDGKHAIIELVAAQRAALAPVLADHSILAFEKGVASGATIESAIQPFHKSFSLQSFGVLVQ